MREVPLIPWLRGQDVGVPVHLIREALMMPSKNLISAVLSQADETAIVAAIEELRAKMPFLVDLSTAERRELPKTGPKTAAFVSGCLNLAMQNPEILPRNFDLEEFKRDVELYLQMQRVSLAVEKLNELVQDTTLAVGSDAFVAALRVYRSAQTEGQAAGLDAALQGLGARFQKTRKRPVAE